MFFDVLSILFFLSAMFVIGYHFGNDKSDYAQKEFTLTILPEKISGSPDDSYTAKIDGKYECSVIEFGEEKIILSCQGYYSDSGYMLLGAKYVSPNQPISAIQSWGYFNGKIYEITDN